MADDQSSVRARRAERVGYFLLRVRQVEADDATTMDGQIERLGAGEKARFASAEELLTLIEHWRPGPG